MFSKELGKQPREPSKPKKQLKVLENFTPIGLINIGNSCHFNVILQTLFNCTKFNESIPVSSTTYPICYIYLLMYDAFLKQNYHILNHILPQFQQKLIYNLGSTKTIQQDAHETFLIVLDKLQHELSKQNLKTFFQGQFIQIMQCQKCHQRSSKLENFEHIILSIANEDIVSIDDALNKYFDNESVSIDDCQFCHQNSSQTLHTYLYSIPIYLIIVLNRFNLHKTNQKNDKLIEYDFEKPLDINKYFSILFTIHNDSSQYHLKSIIHHSGHLNNGHYYCYQKYHHQWYECNDTSISIAPIQSISKENTYILVYELMT